MTGEIVTLRVCCGVRRCCHVESSKMKDRRKDIVVCADCLYSTLKEALSAHFRRGTRPGRTKGGGKHTIPVRRSLHERRRTVSGSVWGRVTCGFMLSEDSDRTRETVRDRFSTPPRRSDRECWIEMSL